MFKIDSIGCFWKNRWLFFSCSKNSELVYDVLLVFFNLLNLRILKISTYIYPPSRNVCYLKKFTRMSRKINKKNPFFLFKNFFFLI